MSPLTSIRERFYRVLNDVAGRLRISGKDPALELAGRFGVRRFIEREARGDSELPPNPWLDRAAGLRKECRDLSRALERAGVRHCFFKGITLLGRFYHLDDRRLDDIDLLVDVVHRNAALAVLHACGYAELGDPAVWGPGANRPGTTMYRTNPATGDRDTEAPFLDVHWGLEPLSTLLPDESLTLPSAVWARVEVQHRIPVLPDEYHAALVLHHLVRHDLIHVRGLLDFALLWDALPKDGGRELSGLAQRLGVSRALSLIGRVLVDDLHVFPLRGVRLGARDWRGRVLLRRLRLRDWLGWAARHAGDTRRHVTVTRSLAWRRFLLADAPRGRQMLGELLTPSREYLRWRWPTARSRVSAWRRHLVLALRS